MPEQTDPQPPLRQNTTSPLVICRACDTLHQHLPLPPGRSALCVRCGMFLYRNTRLSAQRMLVLVSGSLVLFLIAHTFPLIRVELQGMSNTTTILDGLRLLATEGRYGMAIMVFITTFFFPLIELGGLTILLSGLVFRQRCSGFAVLARFLAFARPWIMIDVFVLAIVVSIVKLGDMARILPEPSLWAFGVLAFSMSIISTIDLRHVWNTAHPPPPANQKAGITSSAPFAGALGFFLCPACSLTCRFPPTPVAGTLRCPRCHSVLHLPGSSRLALTWACLIAATILYIPANILPIMRTSSLFGTQEDTIVSGILYFWMSNSKSIATVIFIASIMVPLFKITALSYLALSIQRHRTQGVKARALLYRLVEIVGKWSMLDVFVITLMVSLIRFQAIAHIEALKGGAAFGGVVILTMLATTSLDPRLIWLSPASRKEKTNTNPPEANQRDDA